MLAAPIGIDAIAKWDVGTVVFGDDRGGLVGEELGRQLVVERLIIEGLGVRIGLAMNCEKSIRRIRGRATAFCLGGRIEQPRIHFGVSGERLSVRQLAIPSCCGRAQKPSRLE